jgi:hypothetical protein
MKTHSETIQDYLMNRELRELLLTLAPLHRLFHALLWEGGAPSLSSLDSSLEIGVNAGIDEFLRESAGSLLEYWSKDDLERLNRLDGQINMDLELELIFKKSLHAPTVELEPSLNALITATWLKFVARKNWQHWLKKCPQPRFVKRVRKVEALYQFVIVYISGLLLLMGRRPSVTAWYYVRIRCSPPFLALRRTRIQRLH